MAGSLTRGAGHALFGSRERVLVDVAAGTTPPLVVVDGGTPAHFRGTARQALARYRQPLWATQYRIALVTFDLCCIIAAVIVGDELRFGLAASSTAVSYLGIGAVIASGWMIALQAAGGYDVRHLASGPEEAKRVIRASAVTVSVLAIVCYATKTPIARGFVVGVIPAGTALLLLNRTAVRSFVVRRRRQGAWVQRIIAVGTTSAVTDLLRTTERVPGAGLRVVGACVDDSPSGVDIAPGVPVLGPTANAAALAADAEADVIAVANSGLGPARVRELGWQLEGTGRGLVVAPALTEVAGPRVHVSAVEGLPLVWLEQPQLGRMPRIVKRSMDLVVGAVLLALALPVLVIAAVAIKLTSRGPVLYRQPRLGQHGSEFMMLKLRTMYAGADEQQEQYWTRNEQDGSGVLFKMRRDPRVTRIGRLIRQFSIDELPQLVHVITGRMALVGPRPLATVDSTYTGSARRRLLVRPGLTGLWQISGRSNLTWEDSVRLDLYYVENWTIGLDISILIRTIVAVLARKGAY